MATRSRNTPEASTAAPTASQPPATGPGAEQSQNIWLAGLGAMARAQAEGSKAFDALVKQGLDWQSQAREQIAEVTQRAEALAASDFYKLQNALAARWQPNASWMAALPTINTARQFETTNGALMFPSLQTSPPSLLGRNVYENSVMDSDVHAAATEANYLAIYGDFSQYVVTMRVGSQIELIPHIVGANRRPTGQRGAWLWGRYGADSLIDSAFAMLNVPTTA